LLSLYFWTLINTSAPVVGPLQVLRSVSSWSAGFLDADAVEESIHEAYIDAITKAKHYVYIENQFFISHATHNESVRNHICETLCNRIVRAYK
jgi:phospholipase D1/2